MAPIQQYTKVNMQDLEWCANWKMDKRFYCSLYARDPNRKPKGLQTFLENMFGSKYGGFRYDRRRDGYEVWFKNKDDMLTFKLMANNNG